MPMKEELDPAGYPIDLARPIVFDEGGTDPHTELMITEEAESLGFPGSGYYNVPSIYDGRIYDPGTEFEMIRDKARQALSGGARFPNFPSIEEAEIAAKARSETIGKLRQQELAQARQQQQQRLIMEMLRRYKVIQ